MSEVKFKVKYDLQYETGEFAHDTLAAAGLGGADALVIQSLVMPEDGDVGHTAWSIDGRTGESMSALDLYRSWLAFGAALSHNTELVRALRGYCTMSVEMGVKVLEQHASTIIVRPDLNGHV